MASPSLNVNRMPTSLSSSLYTLGPSFPEQVGPALGEGELSVNHLADIVDKSPAAVSQHLAKLRLARIVTPRQHGTYVFYRLEDDHASRLVTDAILQAQHSVDRVPPHHAHEIAEAAE